MPAALKKAESVLTNVKARGAAEGERGLKFLSCKIFMIYTNVWAPFQLVARITSRSELQFHLTLIKLASVHTCARVRNISKLDGDLLQW